MPLVPQYRAAALQINCETGLKSEKINLEKALHYLNLGLKDKVKLFNLPEAFNFGYHLDVEFLKNRPEDTITISALKEFCIQNKVSVNFGLIERENNQIFNRTIFINSLGLEHRYTKVHLFKSAPTLEDQVFKNGDSSFNLASEFGNLGFLICYDLRFPELSRRLALKGAETLIISSAWGYARGEHFEALLKARAIENQCFIINSDQVGTTKAGLRFAGRSSIIDPLGKVLAQADDEKETLIIAEINLNERIKALEFMNCLSHRVPSAYEEALTTGDQKRS